MATVTGGGGNDTLDSGAGVTGAADSVSGLAGNDLLYGLAGADTLLGGTGDDTLIGGADADTLDGGSGNDTASYQTSGFGVQVNLLYNEATGGDATDDRFVSIENVIGSAFGDTLIGDTGNNVLSGLGGNDALSGNGGQDTLIGGAGADSLSGGGGGDTADYSTSGSGVTVNINDALAEAGGDAAGDSLSGIEHLTGSELDDNLTGDGSSNIISGLGGNDTITGNLGSDTISGGDGADVIVSGPGAPGTTVSSQNLTFDWTSAGRTGGQDIRPGFTQDVNGAVRVEIDYDIVSAPSGNSSTFTVNTGASNEGGSIYVGAGETFDPNSSAQMQHPNQASGSQTTISFSAVPGSGYSSQVTGISFRIGDLDNNESATILAYNANGNLVPVVITENSTLLSVSGNTVTSSSQPNQDSTSIDSSALVTIAGPVSYIVIQFNDVSNGEDAILISDINFTASPVALDDNDSVLGGAGSDTIDAGFGNDTVSGGTGNDSIAAGDGSDLVYGDEGDDTVLFGPGNDTVYGGDGNDYIDDVVGSDLAGLNVLYGGLGDDTVLAGHDADTLFGDAGNDTLYGEAGNDLIYGGAGNDQAFGGTDADTLYGDANSDALFGDSGNDALFGGSEDDTLTGGSGTDTLFGDTGNDLVYAGSDSDLVLGGDDRDTIYGDTGADTLQGDAGNDSLYGGTDNDVLYGGADSDVLEDESGDDTLYGGAGIDILQGGVGRDMLYGGAGQDAVFGGDDQDRIFVGFNTAYGTVPAQNDVALNESVFGGDGGTDNDTLTVDITGFSWARMDLDYDETNAEDGTITFYDGSGGIVGTLSFDDIENLVIVCFTAGTRIMTDRGTVPVEELASGDLVLTRDNGLQPLRWIGQRRLSPAELRARPELQPVRIGAGALGDARPDRSMMVSPQHRVLIEGAKAEIYFGEGEVLVPAKHLVGLAEVARALPAEGVTYVHILFDRHEIVQSDGIWTESFQPAERTLSALDEAARAEVLALFPELTADASAFTAARLSLKAHEAKVLISG